MQINDELMQKSERTVLGLQQMYLDAGYAPYRMSKFEEYDLYADNKDFLISDNVITFTDTSGRLMALKPDVTLSIVKNLGDRPDEVQKVFYRENVYRVSRGTGSYKEMLQAGLECIGKVGRAELLEVIRLAAQSLAQISARSVLALSSLDVIEEAMAGETNAAEARGAYSPHSVNATIPRCAPCAPSTAFPPRAPSCSALLRRFTVRSRKPCRRFAVCLRIPPARRSARLS